MKRFLTFLLSLSLIFTSLVMAGCTDNSDSGKNDTPEDEVTEAEKAGNVIYVDVNGNDTDGDICYNYSGARRYPRKESRIRTS